MAVLFAIAALVIAWLFFSQGASAGTLVSGDAFSGGDVSTATAASLPAWWPVSNMSNPISKLADAILGFESGGSSPSGPAARNNNPGNLKFVPSLNQPGYVESGAIGADERGFAIFPDFATGLDALQRQIASTVKSNPDWTLTQFFQHYLGQNPANPPVTTSEGDPVAYAATVANKLGVSPGDKLRNIFGG